MAKKKSTSAAPIAETVDPSVEAVNPDEVKKLKEHLLTCEGVSAKSPAMKAVLSSLDQAGASPVVAEHVSAPPAKSSKALNAFGKILRTLVLDLPLMLLFGLYISTILLHEVSIQYYYPQVELMKWNKKRQTKELTYYHRECSREDITTDNRTDLMIPEDMSPTDCMDHMLTHGVSVYSKLISDSTAKEARAYIIDRNTKEKGWYVIENEKRYSFGVNVNAHPSIQKALKEIGENKQLNEALRRIVGPDPAIVEFTGITSQYGAADQFMHQDVVPRASAFKYARNFVPTYSLFIPLQDITAEMGSTEVCPGTHQCSDGAAERICDTGGGMLVSGRTGSWKSGSGALLNQQLFHRGTAHVDEKGPDRVLFILTFASRPRYGKNQVESRMIGHEGSYSLKWDQWGHTLSDFSNPAKHMAQPFKTMRALGLYKASGRKWGWDFLTVASMRLANEDTGFEEGKLKTWHKKGGFFFMPEFLKPALGKHDSWQKYVTKTILATQEWAKKMNIQIVIGYFAVVLVLEVALMIFGFKRHGSIFLRAVGRLVFTHLAVLLIALLVSQNIRSSQWARNIKHGKAFVSYRAPVETELPGTLPFETDVLKDTRLQSSYLASYSRMFDVNHPGNKNWHKLINSNSVNYHNLPVAMKKDLAKMVLFEMKTTNEGRLLKQNEATEWTVMTDDEAVTQAHVDLSKASDDNLEFALTQLAFFRTELGAGVFRETALHKKHIHILLWNLRDKIIGSLKSKPVPGVCHPGKLPKNPGVFGPKSKLRLPETGAAAEARFSPTTMPAQLTPVPPYRGAWVQEGDVVDGQYKGEFNEWYRATVTSINPNKGNIDVRYDDGDKDKGLCRMCVRPYIPLEVDEPVAVRVKNGFHDGRVVGVYDDARYDVQTYTIGLRRNVTASSIRRFDYKLGEGAAVEALYQGVGDIWYRGKIVEVNDDETFDVEYDDGDKEYGVEPHQIRLAA